MSLNLKAELMENSRTFLMNHSGLEFHKVFKVEREGTTVIVIPEGDPTAFRYNDVHTESNAVIRLLDDPGSINLILDFSGTDYASSVIIGSLIRMARKATNEGGRAVMCGAENNMLEILSTMGLFKLWPNFEDREQALAAIAE